MLILVPLTTHTQKTIMALGRAHTSTRLSSLHVVSHWYDGSGSGQEPKSNWLVFDTYPSRPPSFVVTFLDIVRYIIFGPVSQWRKSIHFKKKKIQNQNNSSLSHTQPVHQVSSNASTTFWDIVLYIVKSEVLTQYDSALGPVIPGNGQTVSYCI